MLIIELTKKVKATVSQPEIDRVAKIVSIQLKIKSQTEVSLAVVGDKKIKQLNQRYRRQNRITDVLSFAATQDDFILPIKEKYLGEIIISYPQAVRQAKRKKVSPRQEFIFLLVHGLLHLLGYDHEESPTKAKKMVLIQEKIMNQLGFSKELGYN